MTAGVQSFEPGAAYLASPPSSPSSQGKADGKGTGAQPGGEASDFKSEMDLQDAAPEPKSTGHPEKGSAKNAGKKQNTRADRANVNTKDKGKDEAAAAPVAATPVQVVEPQRYVLPVTFAPIQPDETSDDAAQTNTSQDETPHGTLLQANVSNDIVLQGGTSQAISQNRVSQSVIPAEETSQPVPMAAAQNELIPAKTEPTQKSATILKTPASDTVTKASADVPARNVVPESPDAKSVPQADPQSATAPVTIVPVVTNPIVTTPIATSQTSTGQPAAPDQPRTYEIQPVSQPELKVPELTPLEPAPAAATQKVEGTQPSSSPSALAFAARLTAVQQPQETDATIPKNPLRPAPGADAPAPTRIPVRYAPTAQIIQRAEQKSEGDLESQVEPTKYAGPAFERSAPPDFVVPGPPAANDIAKSSQNQPTPEPLPTPGTERIIEPPAAPPTSSRDIRVQVPDNNGGSTQVRFLETGGEVRVSVRTSDTGLAQSLRSHLNDLALRLAEGGVPAEIWKPAPNAAASQNDQHQPDREGRGSEGRHSGSHSGGHSGSQGDQQDQQDRPAWLEEMEASLLARK